jgi:hypothetical protein
VNFAVPPRKYPAPVQLLRSLLAMAALSLGLVAAAQFYNGSQQEFGKNRVQYRDFLWQSYRFPEIETFFYKGGRDVAKYVSISAVRNKKELEKFFDHSISDRVQFVVYNTQGDSGRAMWASWTMSSTTSAE